MTYFYKILYLFKQNILFIMLLLLILPSSYLYAGDNYIKCWKNDKGHTECGNRIPREYYHQKVRYIDSQGVTRKVKDKSQTIAERKSQKRLAALLKKQAIKKRKADAYDTILLKTYLTVDDLLASLNSRLEIIKSRSMVLNSIIKLRQKKYQGLIKQAADMDRAGKEKPKNLIKKLENTRKDIAVLKTQLIEEQDNRKMIKSVFSHDVERFLLSKSTQIKDSLLIDKQAKKLHAIRIDCVDQEKCADRWKKANQFLINSSTTFVIYTTDNITVSDIPSREQDIAMSLSVVNTHSYSNKVITKNTKEAHHKSLIFQIRCHPQKKGKALCNSEKVSHLLTEFKKAII